MESEAKLKDTIKLFVAGRLEIMPLLVYCDVDNGVKPHTLDEITRYDVTKRNGCTISVDKLYDYLASLALIGPLATTPPYTLISGLYQIKHGITDQEKNKIVRSMGLDSLIPTRSSGPTGKSSRNGLIHKKVIKTLLTHANFDVYESEHHYGFGRGKRIPKWDIVAQSKATPTLLLIEAKFQGGEGTADAKWLVALDDCRTMSKWITIYKTAYKRFSRLMID